MKNTLIQLREILETLPSTEKEIAQFILKHPEKILDMSSRDIAKITYTSASSVVRLCHSLGLNGFKELKHVLVRDLATYGRPFHESELKINKSDSTSTITEKVTYQKIDSLLATSHMIVPEILSKCIDLLVNSKNVLLFGLGASALVAEDMSLKLLRLSKPYSFSLDWHSQLLYAQNSTKEEVAFIFSYSGYTEEIIKCVQALKENQTPCIAITRNAKSTLSEIVDYNLFVSCNEALFRSGAFSSRIAQLNIVDMLYVGFIQQYDLLIEQLIYTHHQKDGINEELNQNKNDDNNII